MAVAFRALCWLELNPRFLVTCMAVEGETNHFPRNCPTVRPPSTKQHQTQKSIQLHSDLRGQLISPTSYQPYPGPSTTHHRCKPHLPCNPSGSHPPRSRTARLAWHSSSASPQPSVTSPLPALLLRPPVPFIHTPKSPSTLLPQSSRHPSPFPHHAQQVIPDLASVVGFVTKRRRPRLGSP